MIHVAIGTALGSRIVERRERAGLSQRNLADAAGMSQPTLVRSERGERSITVDELHALAGALGTTYGDLVGDSEVRDRLLFAGRAESPRDFEAMKDRMAFYFEFDAFLDRFGVERVG